MTNPTASTFVRTDVYATTDGGQAAGCIAYWQLSGRAPADVLATALEDLADIDAKNAPRAPTNRQVFRRACAAVAGKNPEVLLDRRGDRIVFVAHADDEPQTDHAPTDLNYRADLVAELTEDGDIAFSDDDHYLVASIKAEFGARVGKVDTAEVSDWLIGFVKRDCKGVSLRPSGGFYYIPSTSADRFRAGVCALRSCSAHAVYEIPAMATTETASAIIAALQVECEQAIAEIQAWQAEDRKRQARSFKTKLAELAELDDKLTAYAEFMDGNLDSVVTSIEDVRVQLSQSLIEAEGGEVAA